MQVTNEAPWIISRNLKNLQNALILMSQPKIEAAGGRELAASSRKSLRDASYEASRADCAFPNPDR